MGTVIMHNVVSVDGFIADANDDVGPDIHVPSRHFPDQVAGRDPRLRLVRLVPYRRCCQYQAMMDVTVEARNDAGDPGLVKLQDETWELNIWATTDELWKLADIENTDWSQRRTIRAGTCVNTPVWWNELGGTVYILVGDDDEAWDMCVTVPLGTVHKILAELGEPPETTPPPFGPTLF